MTDRRPAALAFALGLALGGTALAQDTKGTTGAAPAKDAAAQGADEARDPNAPPVRIVSTQIDRIDPSTRTIAFKGARGNPVTVQVHRGVRNLGELAAGDTVEVRYVDAVASSLKKASAGSKPPGSPEIAARIAAAESQSRPPSPPGQGRQRGGAPTKSQGTTGEQAAPASAQASSSTTAPGAPAADATAGGTAAASGTPQGAGSPSGSGASGAAGQPAGATQSAGAAPKQGDGGRKAGGRSRGGGAVPRVGMRGTLESIDAKAGIVLVKDAKGYVHELTLKDPSVLAGLKTGETVDAVYSEAVAFVVNKGKPKS